MDRLIEIFERYFFFPIFDFWGTPILIVLFVGLFLAETYRRLRRLKISRWERIKSNFGLALTAMPVLRLALIPALVLVARWAQTEGFGLLNWVAFPDWAGFMIGILLLDYGNYLWHVLTHRWNFLWRFHNVHHIDLDLDLTTGIRFHFGEVLLSVFFRGLLIAFIGAPAILVLIYEIVFEGATLFHHSNWKLPYKLEKALSWVIVTPRMHGVHHSIVKRETDSNYSIIFSCWDRLHRSIRLDIPQNQINIGVPSYRNPEEQSVINMLTMPFNKPRPWELPDGEVPERKCDGDRNSLVP